MKRFEISFRRSLNMHYGVKHIPIVVKEPRSVIYMEQEPRILLLRQDRIGDVLVSTAIVRILRERYPQAQLDVLLGRNNIGVRHALDVVASNILVYRKGLPAAWGLIKEIRKNRYDVVVDLTDNASSTSSMLVTYSGARCAVGIDKLNRGTYTHVVPMANRATVNIINRISRLLWPFGIDDAECDLRPVYPVSAEDAHTAATAIGARDGECRIGVNISGSGPERMYSEAGMVRIARYLKSVPGVRPVIFSSPAPDHVAMAARIATAAGCEVAPASSSFHVFACLLSTMHGIVTPDTSTVHLSAAFGQPSVVLFLHDNPELLPWYPYGTTCFACEATEGSIKNIPEDEVLHAVRKLVEHLLSGNR